MKEAGFIPKDAWKPFVESLSKRYKLYAPIQDGDTVTFQPYSSGQTVCTSRPANSSPKSVIFPQCETLFTFALKKDPSAPAKVDVELDAKTEVPVTAILCGRPCDAKGFLALDPVYMNVDPYYRERREKTTIITLACSNPYPACFCTSVDGGPAEAKGSDVLITELPNGYFLEAVTDKGKAVLEDANVKDGASFQAEAKKIQSDAYGKVKKAFAGGKGLKINRERFSSDQFWEEVSAKCISCGACTYICPTCYCFNITDEQALAKGERVRSWDSCMFRHFTLEASGHNPRGIKSKRLQQRIGHKFLYYPEKYGEISCSGCGRCIRHCPASVEISRIVAMLAEPGKAKTERMPEESKA